MTTIFDRNLLPEFESVRDDNETILWLARPQLIPYFLNGFAMAGGALVFFAIYYFWYWNINEKAHPMYFNRLFAILPFLLFLWGLVARILSYSNTRYAYSNKRVMMRTGFFGTEFKSIDHDKISDIAITVNFVERLFQVGTIRFFSGRSEVNDEGVTRKLYDRWEAIAVPYEVFKRVKQVALDIKTDIHYPNALRPEINPGYTTLYDRKN